MSDATTEQLNAVWTRHRDELAALHVTPRGLVFLATKYLLHAVGQEVITPADARAVLLAERLILEAAAVGREWPG